MKSDTYLRRWFLKFNERYFNGELPNNVALWWEPCSDAAAVTIEISPAEDGNPAELGIKIDPAIHMFGRMTKLLLLHEMVHIKLWGRSTLKDHGLAFDREIQRLLTFKAVRKLI
jgi:hypothetical protein